MRLICKKEHKHNGEVHFTIGNIYDVIEYKHQIYKFIVKGNIGHNLGFTLYSKYRYIWDYFISPTEWRELQLNSILDEI